MSPTWTDDPQFYKKRREELEERAIPQMNAYRSEWFSFFQEGKLYTHSSYKPRIYMFMGYENHYVKMLMGEKIVRYKMWFFASPQTAWVRVP